MLFGILLVFAIQIPLATVVLTYPKVAHAIPTEEVGPVLPLTIWQKIWGTIQKALKTAADVAFKNVLKNYLNNLAYNTATKIATGKPGQKPLFTTDYKKILIDAGDAAAGDFLDALVNGNSKQGKCATGTYDKAQGVAGKTCFSNAECPSIYVLPNGQSYSQDKQYSLPAEIENSGLSTIISGQCLNGTPTLCASAGKTTDDLLAMTKLHIFIRAAIDQPVADVSSVCPLSSILKTTKNSEARLHEASKMFNPEASEFGQFLIATSSARQAAEDKKNETKLEKLVSGPFDNLKTAISGAIKTPANIIGAQAENMVSDSLKPYLTYTGTAIADAVGVFTNTLAQKLLDKYIFNKGFNPAATSTGTGFGGLSNGSSPGIAAAKFLFSSLAETSYSVGGEVDILSTLASCPDVNDPTPDTCVIDANFQTAISQAMTVRQALDQGLLDGGKIIGFNANGKEPDYVSGYPYRSLLILRKYRIIPVGWELAAEYIQKYAAGNYSLNTLIADYDNSASPFYHLVDPNWVLKSPSIFCKKEGPGEKIDSSTEVRTEDTNGDSKIDNKDIATTTISRQDYCADEQTCIAENEDGSCLRYGYCLEEKPTWRFDGTACQAQDNTCQSFTTPEGKTVSYLKDTLDYNGCNASNAGCMSYYTDYLPATQTWDINGGKIPFNKNVETCLASAEGCHEFMPIGGANLLANSGFETVQGFINDGVVDTFQPAWTSPDIQLNLQAVSVAGSSITSAQLTSTDGAAHFINNSFDTGRATYGRQFTASFSGKLGDSCANPDGLVSLHLTSGGQVIPLGSVNVNKNWTRYTASAVVKNRAVVDPTLTLSIGPEAGNTCGVIIDNAQLEEGGLTDYNVYENSAKTYLKKAPEYLNCTGNAQTDPAACNAFALKCTDNEVGCNAYTSQTTGETINGVVTNPNLCDPNDPGSCDQCPVEFAGCKAYRELPITNIPARVGRDPVSFVASTGISCPASAVGCEEYTNLEALSQGGESREYYSLISQCVNADNPNATPYYSWEGSDEFGFQLKNYQLLRSDPAVPTSAPCTNMNVNNWGTCSDNTAYDDNGDGIAEPHPVIDCQADYGSNPDCVQFYNAAGTIYYRLKSKIIYASSACKEYRNSIDGDAVTYHMIPGQGLSCNASYAGCRAYKGNAGDNVRTIYQNTFESGNVLPWTGNLTYSNESVQVGGHSILTANAATYLDVSTELGMRTNSSYSITFWAKGALPSAPTFVAARLALPGPPAVAVLNFPGVAQARNDGWNRYEIGPLFIPANTDLTGVALQIFGDNAFYLDNIVIREVTQSIYLIKNSYTECSGWENCDHYLDRNQLSQYLKSFTQLCSSSKVGCETMIDTQNSSSRDAAVYTTSNNPAQTLTVDPDNFINLVNDPAKACSSTDKGCQFLGKPTFSQENTVTGFDNVYLKNNPDQYSTNMCLFEDIGCLEYKQGDGLAYFRNPGIRVCEYKKISGQNIAGWYKAGTVTGPPDCDISTGYCSATAPTVYANRPCATDVDCGGGTCVASDKITPQPVNNWVGICPDTSSGCTEYRDPESPVLPQNSTCDVAVPGSCKGYYYLSDTVDKGSCNGVVNRSEGCRLLDDTSETQLTYSSVNSEDKKTPSICSDPATCTADANLLLKVRPDRTCAKWLECQTSWQVKNKDGKTEDMCLELGTCDRMDPQTGQCTHLANLAHANETYNSPTYVDKIKNYSGLVTAGLEWGRRCKNNPNLSCTSINDCKRCSNDATLACTSNADCQNGGLCPTDIEAECPGAPQIIEGYFPYSTMQEVGLDAVSGQDMIKNGDFGDSKALVNKVVSDYIACGNGGCTSNPHPTAPLDSPDFSVWNHPLGDGTSIAVGEETSDGVVSATGSNNLDENNVLIVTHPEATPVPAWWGTAVDIPNLKSNQDYVLSFRVKRSALPATIDDNILVVLGWTPNGQPLWPGPSPVTWTVIGYSVVNGQAVGTDWATLTFRIKMSTVLLAYLVDLNNNGGAATISDVNDEINGASQFQIRFSTNEIAGAGSKLDFYLDDVSMKSALEVQSPPIPATLINRSCRMYPGADIPTCTYIDENNTTHRGWYGYCLLHDPQNPKYCLSWWPVDLIAGESNIFNVTTAGYQGRSPLYMCAQAEGNNEVYLTNASGNRLSDVNYELDLGGMIVRAWNGTEACCDTDDCSGNHSCGGEDIKSCNWTCGGGNQYNIQDNSTNIREDNIDKITISMTNDGGGQNWQFAWPIFNKGTAYNGSICSPDQCSNQEHRLERLTHVDVGGTFYTIWSLYPTSCVDSGSGDNNNACLWLQFLFKEDSGELFRIRFIGEDTEGDDEGATMYVKIYLREQCKEIVQVAKSLENQAWVGRTASGSKYVVADLLYHFTQDFAPFGSAKQPSGEPGTWTWISGRGPLLVVRQKDADMSKAGSPYSCGNANGCTARGCNWDTSNACDTEAHAQACIDHVVGGVATGDGYCIGLGDGFCEKDATRFCTRNTQNVDCSSPSGDLGPCVLRVNPVPTDPAVGLAKIQLLFAKIYGAWEWNGEAYTPNNTLNSLAFDNWDNMRLCTPTNPRTDTTYCANKPTANNFVIGDGTNNLVRVKVGQSIQLHFNMTPDPEQLPINAVAIAWSDNPSDPPQYIQGPLGAGPMIMSHFYTIPGIYTPHVQITDNWGFCSNPGSSAGTPREQSCNPTISRWQSSNIQVIVTP